MYRIDKHSFLSVSASSEMEQELGDFLREVSLSHPDVIENSSGTVRTLEMKTTSGWIQDFCTEIYCDMSQSPDKILRQAYEATSKICTNMPSFSEFCKEHRVI